MANATSRLSSATRSCCRRRWKNLSRTRYNQINQCRVLHQIRFNQSRQTHVRLTPCQRGKAKTGQGGKQKFSQHGVQNGQVGLHGGDVHVVIIKRVDIRDIDTGVCAWANVVTLTTAVTSKAVTEVLALWNLETTYEPDFFNHMMKSPI